MTLRWTAFLLLLAGCIPSGPLGSLRPVPEVDAARVIFIRPWRFQGAGATYAVTIDGIELYGLDIEEHVGFAVPAGERLIGVRMPDPIAVIPSRIHPTVTLHAEPGRTYYFRLSSGRIDRTTEAEGLEFVKRTRDARESGGR